MTQRIRDSGKIRVCHLASGDLWAGAEVQIAMLLPHLSRKYGWLIAWPYAIHLALTLNPKEYFLCAAAPLGVWLWVSGRDRFTKPVLHHGFFADQGLTSVIHKEGT